MAVSKVYKAYIEDCLSRVGNVRIRPMMGSYLAYYREKLIGIIGDGLLFIKRTVTSDRLLAGFALEYPYEGSKTLMWVIENPENTELLRELFEGMYNDLPMKK